MLVSLILVTIEHTNLSADIEKTTATATSLELQAFKKNVRKNVTDLRAMNLVTRNYVVVTCVLGSVERDA